MNFFKFKSIRIRLISLFSVIFIPLFSLIIYTSVEQKEKAHELAIDNALWIAQNLSQQQKFVEDNVKQLLTILSHLPEVKDIDTIRIHRLFSAVLGQNPYYASLLIVDSKGEMIASVKGSSKLNISDRKYFLDVLINKKFTAGEFTKGRLTRKPVIHYALPLFNSDSTIKAVLVTSFDVKYYDSFIKLPEFSDDIVFTFLDHKGIILYHSANISITNGLKERKDILKNFTNNNSAGTFTALGNDGINRLYGFKRLKGSNNDPYMYIYAGIPEKVAYADYNKTLYRNAIIMLLVALLVVALAYIFSNRYIIQPIDRLLNSAELISEGNLETQTDLIRSSSELGKLSIAIDQMTSKLRARDLERKKVEKDLTKLKERFELAINSANIGIWDWHIRNNSLIWDKNMFDLYGLSPENFDFNMENWKLLIHPSDLIKFNNQFTDAIRLQSPFRSEFRIQHSKLGIKYIRIFAAVILDKEKNPVRLIGVNWDITERKNLEQKLYESNEIVETKFKLKSAYLANISHEIRTPIHGIIGFTQILKSNKVTHTELIQYLDIIEISGNKLMVTMANIIDFQLLEAGQLKLILTNSSISEILVDVYQNQQLNSDKTKSNCSIVFDSNNEDIHLLIDKQRVAQILITIIEHLKEINKNCDLHLGWEVDQNALICFVKVDTENTENIKNGLFEICNSNVNTNNNNLAGLSLALSNSLAEYMGGKISADTNKDGFCINLILPLENGKVFNHQNLEQNQLLA